MSRFSRMRGDRLERELRAAKPEPRADFLLGLTNDMGRARSRSPYRASRTAFALAVLTFVVGTFASFGGISYAAAGATSAVDVVKKIVVSSAQQQYGPTETPPLGEQGSAGQGEVAQAVASDTLPFTGISLAVTAALGLLLFATGLMLRRAERRKT